MIKLLRPLILSLFPLLLAACASSTGPTPQSADAQRASGSFQPSVGNAGLYIYKTGVVVTAADSFQIYLDGQMAGLVAWNSYLYLPLSPGHHTITSGTSRLGLFAQAGQNYFVRQQPNLDGSGQIASSTLSLVLPQVGKQEVQKMQQANFGN